MNMESKWTAYQEEEMTASASFKAHRAYFFGCLLLFLFAICGIFFSQQSLVEMSLSLVLALCFLACTTVFMLEEDNKIKKVQFFKKNKEELFFYRTKESDLIVLKNEGLERIFLIITGKLSGRRNQLFTFATETEKGIEIKNYGTNCESEFFFKEIAVSEDNKPRLEVKKKGFASEKLESAFIGLVEREEFCTKYTFYVPKGSVKKSFI